MTSDLRRHSQRKNLNDYYYYYYEMVQLFTASPDVLFYRFVKSESVPLNEEASFAALFCIITSCLLSPVPKPDPIDKEANGAVCHLGTDDSDGGGLIYGDGADSLL